MKKILLNLFLLSCSASAGLAQDSFWTMEQCMRYAVENSTAVKKQMYENDSRKADYTSAALGFLPSFSAGVSAQYNFGRAIGPGTNTYVNTTTFNNYYGLSASLPVFYGGQIVNQYRLAKSNRQSGMNDLQKIKDDLALNTLEAFVNVVYYRGTVRFAEEKLEESNRTLYKICRQEELGIKGMADVAQVRAQVAGDDYNLTRQQNAYNTALLRLKEYMNYPYDEELQLDTAMSGNEYLTGSESVADIYEYARETNPAALQAAYQLKANRLYLLMQKGSLFPSLSFSTGVNTSYYDILQSGEVLPPFRSQFKNNRGEYVSLSLNIPLFNRLSRLRDIRRAGNNVRIAEEQQSEVLRRLQTVIEQSVLERDGYAKESVQMEKKLESDRIAYEITVRKFEEGLMSPLDLQTSANTLIESKANLLQRQLMYLLKCKQVDYYKGEPLVK
ncbi:MAG: TolC family protein [Tannerella sp.]|jgi:outer membrane protein|nr:TolC family protein [Tannerella sp.]